MDNFLKMVNIQSVLFLYMVAGVIARRMNILTDHTRNKLTDLMIYITLPCMIVDSFGIAFSMDSLVQASGALLTAAAMAFLALFLGKFIYNRFVPGERCIMQYGTLVTNSGFAGLPVVSGMYGAEGLMLGSMFIIPTRILMWSAGISLFSKEGSSTWEAIKKVAKHPSLIAVYVGLIRMFTQLPLPEFVDTAIDNIGGCTSPLAMMLVGAILSDVPLKNVLEAKILYLILVRQIAMPLVCLGALKLLGVDALTTGVSVILSGMPIGSTTAILAQKYGADAGFASKCVFLSTLSSLITVPILALFL